MEVREEGREGQRRKEGRKEGSERGINGGIRNKNCASTTTLMKLKITKSKNKIGRIG